MAKKNSSRLGIKKTGGSSNVTKRLVPEVPFNAPAGSYDVGLDAAVRGSNRGLADLITDAGRDQERADYQTQWGRDDITRQRDEGLGDLDTQNTRFTRDMGTNRQRGGEDYTKGKGRLSQDYQSTIAGLLRNYDRLGQSQRQQAAGAGYSGQGGGAVAQAARKRAENQAWDRKPVDTNFQRGNEDMDTGWNRQQQDWNTAESDWGADYGTQKKRITDGADRNLGQLAVTGSWDSQDRQTGVTRGVRENREFGVDTQAAKVQQVQQTTPGWLDQWKKRNDKRGFRSF
jgi:hypothetical protein